MEYMSFMWKSEWKDYVRNGGKKEQTDKERKSRREQNAAYKHKCVSRKKAENNKDLLQ